MRILLAGASGTLGRTLVPQLQQAGHTIVGVTRSPESAVRLRARGVQPLVADVLDRDRFLAAVRGQRADAVVHELTALSSAPTHYRSMRATNELRDRGTTHLLEAAVELGATRFLTQSIVFGYGYRRTHPPLVDEDAPFGQPEGAPTDGVHAALASTERQVLGTPGIEGISLRYGLFYGLDAPLVARMLRRRMLPVTRFEGKVPTVHHEDAAAATVAALTRGVPGSAYNVADDTPVSWRRHMTAAARALGAPAPFVVPAWLLRASLPYAAELMTRLDLRVTSERAHRDLGWTPRYPSVEDGWRAAAATR